jgi:pimeloyl-ACP methyl ester carboxylesterase
LQGITDYSGFPRFNVTLNGLRLHYIDVGEGPAMVLVHGSPLSSFSFRHQIGPLSAHFRVVAPDLPGFGQSEPIKQKPIFVQQAKMLRALFDYLSLGSIRLLGHDWGGPISLGAVADQPERVHRLVLVNTTLRSDFRPPAYWKQFTTSRIGELLLVRLNVFSWGLPLMMRAARSADVREYYARPLRAQETRRTVLRLERLEGFAPLMQQVEATMAGTHIPTMILWGHPDAYFRRTELERLIEMFPNATVCEIAGGGHFPMDDMPQAVTHELLEFCRGERRS